MKSRKVLVLFESQEATGNASIQDIIVQINSQEKRLLGSGGSQRELSFIERALGSMPKKSLPVLIGSGAGFALEHLLHSLEKTKGKNSPLLIVDKEEDIIESAKLKERFSEFPSLHWVAEKNAHQALQEITRWQNTHGNLPLYPFTNPFYLRLDKEYYTAIRASCEASAKVNIWDKINYPRFSKEKPKILLLMSKYFLIGEFEAALKRMDVPYVLLRLPEKNMGTSEFIEQLMQTVLSFKPDFAFTINHLGVDREGVLIELLEKIRLPLASWFVDNPHLVLHLYDKLVSPWTTLFTWDTDNIESLHALGFEHVHYLPLGSDTERFKPTNVRGRKEWQSEVSFVGNSMVHKVTAVKKRSSIPAALTKNLVQLGAEFSASDERFIEAFLRTNKPDLYKSFCSITDMENKLHFEAMLTWEATKQYRLSCVTSTFPFSPLIVGDDGWHEIIPSTVDWSYLPAINYYDDLPRFYPCSSINFNCTSKQMKGAVNQRVFDVPAVEAFILTDYREQVENLFELDKEIICYHSPEEAKELIKKYLASPAERNAIAKAARKRVLAHHTYEHRVASLISTMRSIYG